ncbi:hypothetical protein KDK77_06620 [bacterium]|nr:hypothetical protein [bacterium]
MTTKEFNPVTAASFKKKKSLQVIFSLPLIASIVGIILLKKGFLGQVDKTYGDILYLCAIINVAVYAGVTIINWRCPSCKSYLGRNTSISFCPSCGEQLK